MSEFYEDEGLTMEQASPDLSAEETPEEEPTGTEVVDGAPKQEADNRSETKKVSDRINAIRAENDARIKDLEDKLKAKDDMLLKYRAAEEGISEAELAERDRRESEEFRRALHNDPEFLELQQRDFERQKQEVLTRLQTAFPDDGVKDLEVLPQDFFRMLQAGVSPETAYRASVADAQKPTPPTTGSVKSKGEPVKGNLTPEQALSMDTNDWIKWLDEHDT